MAASGRGTYVMPAGRHDLTVSTKPVPLPGKPNYQITKSASVKPTELAISYLKKCDQIRREQWGKLTWHRFCRLSERREPSSTTALQRLWVRLSMMPAKSFTTLANRQSFTK